MELESGTNRISTDSCGFGISNGDNDQKYAKATNETSCGAERQSYKCVDNLHGFDAICLCVIEVAANYKFFMENESSKKVCSRTANFNHKFTQLNHFQNKIFNDGKIKYKIWLVRGKMISSYQL